MKNNEQLLTLLLKGATDGIHILDDQGTVVEATDSFAESLGYQREHVIGMSVSQWDAKYSKSELSEIQAKVLSTAENIRFDTLHRRKDGSVFPVEVSLRPVEVNGRHFIYCSSRDISARLDTQEALRISEEQFRGAFECGASGMALVSPEGLLLKVNRKFCEILGYSEAELLQLNFPEFTHPDDIEADMEQAQRVLAGEISSYQMKKRYISKHGEIIFAQIGVSLVRKLDGSPFYFVGQCQDVTAQALAEMKVRENEERLNYALNATGEGVWDWNIRSGRVHHNQRWCELLGLQDSASEHSIDEIVSRVHPDDRARARVRVDAALNGTEDYECELRILQADGHYIWTLDRAVVVERDHAGAPVRMVGSIKDVSALKVAQVQLIQSSKMASLGKMAAGIAHEINNPLLVILGKTDQIIHDLEGDYLVPKLHSDLDKIKAMVNRISKIVRGLRFFSRSAEKDPMHTSSVSDIVSETLELCQERFKFHNVALKLKLDSGLSLRCRPTQISQVMMNLLSNAFDAVEKQTEKWIELTTEELKPSRIRISITDSGRGIPIETAGKIMDPFFTTKDVGYGTGLGLSIARGIIEEHQGELFYDDSCANTRFIIELPVEGC
jgi:PAS domain S-box-containing protein